MTFDIEDHTEEVGLRERKKQQTRTAIHEAALHLIEEQGLEETTIEQICQAVDVSTRTFFNYYPSKAAAALELAGTVIDPEVEARFRAATGGLVAALCDAIGDSAELRPSHKSMKNLVTRRPELLPTLTQNMLDVRSQFVALAAQRSSSPQQAELAVTFVLAAMNRVMRDNGGSNGPLAQQLRQNIDLMVRVNGEQLQPVVT